MRRAFITLLGGAAVTWPLAARAQQFGKPHLIGVMMPLAEGHEEAVRRRNAFERGREALGWTNGQNIRIEYRWLAADRDRIRSAAIELVGLKPDVIVVSTALVLTPLQQQPSTIPSLFTQITDPVSSGIVASLARPGGNVTGFAPAEFSMYGKLLETLKEAAPNLTRVAIVMNPEQIPQVGMSRAIEAAAPSLGLKTVNLSVRGSIEDTFASFAPPASPPRRPDSSS